MNYPTYVPQWYIWIIGAFLPYIESFIIQKSWKSWVKFFVAFGISIGLALGAVYLGGQFDVQHILITVGVIFTLGQGFYDTFWKGILNPPTP